MLTFKDKKSFDQLTLDLAKRDEAYIRAWENQLGFKSLYTIYEEIIQEEDKFLEHMVKKYGEDSEVTREDIGYTKLTQSYLDKGTIIISNVDDMIDPNVTIPILTPLVNADGFVRIGNEIRQYKFDYLKVILDGEYSAIDNLKNLSESTDKIHVAKVERQQFKISDLSRRQALSSCDVSAGSHRLIAYEEMTVVNEGGIPCPFYNNSYYIKLRSLKKILGTWQNFKTSQFTLTSTVHFNHLNCDYSVKYQVASFTNSFWQIGGNYHTFSGYFVRNYDTGPCSSFTANCYSAGTLAFVPGATRYHLATGVNSTQCDLP